MAAGRFSTTPAGVILHGTRSGQTYNTAQEYASTKRFVAGGAAGLGWNLTVGDDILSLHLDPDQWGWNAREASRQFLAAEFAQARLGSPITDGQVRAFCWWFVQHARQRWLSLPLVFPNHADLPSGARDGKTDVELAGDHTVRDRILARLRALGVTP